MKKLGGQPELFLMRLALCSMRYDVVSISFLYLPVNYHRVNLSSVTGTAVPPFITLHRVMGNTFA